MGKQKSSKIRVLLVDDHPIVVEGIRTSLQNHPQIEVVGHAADGDEAIRKTTELQPDIVLMDISMPNMSGIESIAKLSREVPATKILVLTMHDTREYVSRILRSGARGYVLKDIYPEELVQAIETVSRGGVYFSPHVNQLILSDFVESTDGQQSSRVSELSQREREVLTLIAEGYTNKVIANRLFVSVRTVETHRERIMHKLNIHSAAGLTRWAIASGLVRLR